MSTFFIGDGNKEVTRRKGTVLTHVWNLPEEKRILVKCNQLGQPIGKEGGLLGQFLGTIARNGGYCPLDVNDWRKVKKDNADTILQCIQVCSMSQDIMVWTIIAIVSKYFNFTLPLSNFRQSSCILAHVRTGY
jgi:hypothetical protein